MARYFWLLGCLIAGLTMLPSVSWAAVDWSDCHTITATTTIPVGATTTVANLITPLTNTSKAFLLLSATGTINISAAADHMVSGAIINPTQVQFDRGRAATAPVEIAYTVVECLHDEFTVQRGSVVISGGNIASQAIGPADPTRSMVLVSSQALDIGSTEVATLVIGRLQGSGTTVEVQRSGPSGINTTVRYEVVTFSTESAVTVQTKEVVLNPGMTVLDDALTASVDTGRTWLYCSWDAAQAGVQAAAVGCELASSTMAKFHRYQPGGFTNRIRYYAVTFPEASVNVQHGAVTIDPTGTDGIEFDYSIGVSSLGSTDRAFSFVTNTSFDLSTGYPRNRWLQYVADSTTIKTATWRSDPAGNTDQATLYWQAFNFFGPYEVTGWGWIGNAVEWTDVDNVSTGATPGLISFNCSNVDSFYGPPCAGSTRPEYKVELEHDGCGSSCDVTGIAWVGAYDSTAENAAYPLGIIQFDPDVSTGTPIDVGDDATTSEDEQLDAHWNEETNELYGWARWYALAQYEDTIYGAAQANDWGWIKLRGPIGTGTSEYGATFDQSTGRLAGWVWNDNGSEPGSDGPQEVEGSGLGWIKFDLDLTAAIGSDWLQTIQGDVYAREGISVTNAAPPGEYNATYLIQTDDTITNFSSQYGSIDANYLNNTDYDSINVPIDNGHQVYRGSIGTIHVNELIDQAASADTDTSGDCDDSLLSAKTTPLNHRIFYCANNLDINSNVTFYNGSASAIGSGTIVIGGDLRIHDNMSYFNNMIDDHINNLASVAWIVLGRVEIDPTVTQLVGTFVVLGDVSSAAGFSTGVGTLPLSLQGSVLARSYNFGRHDVGTSSNPIPAEQFAYDGRVVANTPPGLEDFSRALPSVL
ncbi:MAG: hypothetical protein HYV33_01395 [Candidatus Kerfeldbacteria bacterium]|nr:hypothetical protein [Candidatus Kerfeldbacteria bacterium]